MDAHPIDEHLWIEESDPCWPGQYRELAAEIVETLGDDVVLGIQHIGSTAVPGLPAKPILDVDLTVPDPSDEPAYVPVLRRLGYVHWITEPGWHQHRLLKRIREPRVHLHVYGPECPEVVRTRMFRDWLTAHPEDRRLYAAAKREAAARTAAGEEGAGPGAGMRYNAFKEPVVHEIYDRIFGTFGHDLSQEQG